MAKMIKRVNIVALTATALWLAGTSLAGAADVNVYSSRHYPTDQAMYDKFTAETGIKVNVVQGDINGLVQRLQREGANSPADVIITVDAANLYILKNAKLLQPFKSATVDEVVPANLRDPDGQWFSIAVRSRVIAYNTDKVKPADIPTCESLADPKFKGKVLTRSSNHTYNLSLIASMIANDGLDKAESWAKGLVANFARAPQGGDTDQLKAIAAGEADIALTNHYYYARLKGGSDADKKIVEKIAIAFPNQADRGAHINVSGVGLTKNAPNKAEATKFLEFLISKDAQKVMSAGTMEFPVRADVEADPILASFGKFKVDTLNLAKLGEATPDALKVADRAGWR